MEFKVLRNIESSFKALRLYAILFVVLSLGVSITALVLAFRFAEQQREKVYVLDQGRSLMVALSQDVTQNRPIEGREHVRRFHELFFQSSPNKVSIEENVSRALELCDKSAYNYYQDLKEKGFYRRLIENNITQEVKIDSIRADFNVYPYQVKVYARQFLVRESNIMERALVTSCELINTSRSDVNPQGFLMEKFIVLDNKEIRIVDR